MLSHAHICEVKAYIFHISRIRHPYQEYGTLFSEISREINLGSSQRLGKDRDSPVPKHHIMKVKLHVF
jgi:hypothetical protein